jgi:hypothetical protein
LITNSQIFLHPSKKKYKILAFIGQISYFIVPLTHWTIIVGIDSEEAPMMIWRILFGIAIWGFAFLFYVSKSFRDHRDQLDQLDHSIIYSQDTREILSRKIRYNISQSSNLARYFHRSCMLAILLLGILS